MKIAFPSLAEHSSKAYTLSDDLWQQYWRCRDRAIAPGTGVYDTYGDGMVQHCSDYIATIDHAADYCASLAQHLISNVQDSSALSMFASCTGIRDHNRLSRKQVEFLVSIKSGERRRYYSMAKLAVSSDPRKSDSKSWDLVPDWADGTTWSAIRIHLGDGTPRNPDPFLVRCWNAADICEHTEELIPYDRLVCSNLGNDFDFAFTALRNAVRACRAYERSASGIKTFNLIHNQQEKAA